MIRSRGNDYINEENDFEMTHCDDVKDGIKEDKLKECLMKIVVYPSTTRA